MTLLLYLVAHKRGHRCKKRFFKVLLKFKKHVFYVFKKIFECFFVLCRVFVVVKKRTKLQIWQTLITE